MHHLTRLAPRHLAILARPVRRGNRAVALSHLTTCDHLAQGRHSTSWGFPDALFLREPYRRSTHAMVSFPFDTEHAKPVTAPTLSLS